MADELGRVGRPCSELIQTIMLFTSTVVYILLNKVACISKRFWTDFLQFCESS